MGLSSGKIYLMFNLFSRININEAIYLSDYVRTGVDIAYDIFLQK